MKKKWYQINIPNTHWGFPVESESSLVRNSKHKVKVQKGNRGIALMIAIMTVATVMTLMADLITSSNVNLELAASNRDRIAAEYTAKSGVNLALFMNIIDWGMDLFLYTQTKEPPKDSNEDLWGMLNGLPIGSETSEQMTSVFKLSKLQDESVLTQLEFIRDNFTLNVSDESSKINLNYCAIGQCFEVRAMIEALLSCPVEKSYLDKKEVEPKQIAARIKDYIDFVANAEPESGFSDEDDPYQDQPEKYRAKNAPFDSLDELKMVAGWDDDLHTIFSSYFTVYPYQQKAKDKPTINFNTAQPSLLRCLVPSGLSAECRENYQVEKNRIDKEGGPLVQQSLEETMQKLLCYQKPGADEQGSSDKTKWFKENSRIFKIEVVGKTGEQTRTVTMVIERLHQKEMKQRKLKQSYDLMYWRMM